MDVTMMTQVDVSALERLIPQVVAFGRRTLREQCVTSAAIICLNAQRGTAFVTVGQIDEELQVEVRGYTATGRPSKAKKPRIKRVTTVAGARVPLAVLIVMARTNPESAYSQLTGNRWPLNLGMLPSGPGSAAARQAMIAQWVNRMTLSRHSSTHFLQHGWAPAIRTLLTNPDYMAGARKRGISGQNQINPQNVLDTEALGGAVIDLTGDACVVTSENAVGEGSTAALDARHRAALIREGTPPLQAAIDVEAATVAAKIQEYLDRGMALEIAP